MIKLASESKSQSEIVRKSQTSAVGAEINKIIQRTIDKGEQEAYVVFPLSIKEECLTMLKAAGYEFTSSGNVTHNGKYQIRISWK